MKKLTLEQMATIEGGGFWKCLFGTVGTGVLGFFAGFAFGGWGGIIGAVGGAMAGAATSCEDW
ncbi:MAG: Blp family class II bacteriocin [Thermoflexibacter sp.]|jgi:hypothetical protein|nr:Blp family class II bacteriocin [Thermoflexibacter sp.]